MTVLLDAIDAVTNPVVQVRWQDTDHDHEWQNVRSREGDALNIWRCIWCDETVTTPPAASRPEQIVRRREDASLLDQLRAAVGSSIGGDASGRPGRERVPIDIAALTLYEDIDGRIRSWMDELGARPAKNATAAESLRAWHVFWIGGVHAEGLDDRYAAIVEGWERQIRDKLQPPNRIEITAPCPLCGQEWINVGSSDPNDVEMVRVLNAIERPTLEDSYAMCQACSTVWLGVGRMRQLRGAMDEVVESWVKALEGAEDLDSLNEFAADAAVKGYGRDPRVVAAIADRQRDLTEGVLQ